MRVAIPCFDRFTIVIVAGVMNTLSIAILAHLSVGMHYGFLPVGLVIIFNILHHRLERILWQFKLGIASALILGEQSNIPVPVLSPGLFILCIQIAECTIRRPHLLRCFSSTIALYESVTLVPFPIILRI